MFLLSPWMFGDSHCLDVPQLRMKAGWRTSDLDPKSFQMHENMLLGDIL